jgi:hypothetical protein
MTELTLTANLKDARGAAAQLGIEAARLEEAFDWTDADAPIRDTIRDLRILRNAVRNAADQRDYEARRDTLLGCEGDRVRITWPNGSQRTGVVSRRTIGESVCAELGGSTLMGELTDATRIEVMVGRRYEVIADWR